MPKPQPEDSRLYARVVMSDEAPESKIGDTNLRLLRNLEQRNVIELCPIRRELFTGGEYRKVMTERADAMIAIGGGKGTYSAGTEMIAQGKPVLPFDLQLGSTVDDGDGAVALHREMVPAPNRFLPNTYQDIEKQSRVALLGPGNQRGGGRGASISRDACRGTRRHSATGPVNEHQETSGDCLAGCEGPPYRCIRN